MPTACETEEWLGSLDSKGRLEAILAGYHPPPSSSRKSISSGDEPFTTVGLFIEYVPHEVIIMRETQPSPTMDSIKRRLRRLSTATNLMLFSRPPTPDSPSPYRSPSPDTICCGLIAIEKPVKVYV